jgi:ATP-dependent RNA helicase DHX57
VLYVVDSGKVKETQYDAETGLSRLAEIWTTRAAGRQRRGRAGRTQPGTCYKLYTRAQEQRFGAFPVPEIKRVPLESIALTVKVAKEGEDVKVRAGRLWLSDDGLMGVMALTVVLESGGRSAGGSGDGQGAGGAGGPGCD